MAAVPCFRYRGPVSGLPAAAAAEALRQELAAADQAAETGFLVALLALLLLLPCLA